MRIMLNDKRQVRVGSTWVDVDTIDWSVIDTDKAVPDFKVRFKCFTSVDEVIMYLNRSTPTEEVVKVADIVDPVPITQATDKVVYDYVTYMGLPIFGLPKECHEDGVHFVHAITVRRVTYEPAYIRIEDGKLVAVGLQRHVMIDV